jgi:hypothetical protein
MINHLWNARYVEFTRQFDSAEIPSKIHWALDSTTTEVFNYKFSQYGSVDTNLDHASLMTITAQDALTEVLLALGSEEVARLEQFGADQLQKIVIPVVEFPLPPEAPPPGVPPGPEGPAP